MGEFQLTGSKSGGPFNLIRSLFSRLRGPQKYEANHSLQNFISSLILLALDYLMRLTSLLILLTLNYLNLPLAVLGGCLQFTLNLFRLNGGVFRTMFGILTGDVQVPRSHTKEYLSMVGLLHDDFKLYEHPDNGEISTSPTEAGNRYFSYLSIMAAKIAYENEMVIKHHVSTDWNMNFEGFFSCWNAEHKRRSTEAFMFTDRKEDAQLIVLAFRGTEPFDADDWKTDFDFDFCPWDGVGKVHFGFLEALGLASRSQDDLLDHLGFEKYEPSSRATYYRSPFLVNPNTPNRSSTSNLLDTYKELKDPQKPLAFYAILQKLIDLLKKHEKAKFIVTGHSLGGALAALFAGVLLEHNDENVKPTMLMERLFSVYTFGQPRVGDFNFAEFVKNKLNDPYPRYFRVVYSFDMVPTMPFDDPVMGFKHFGVGLYFNFFYREKNLKEEPIRDPTSASTWILLKLRFFLECLLFFIPKRVVASWELCRAVFQCVLNEERYKENKLSLINRLFAFILPEISAHAPINYLNSVSPGPPKLDPRPPHDSEHSPEPHACFPDAFSYQS